jgi:hypothetical protein
MGELWSYFYVCQTAAYVDCDQRRDVRDCEAVSGNELMSAPVRYPSVRDADKLSLAALRRIPGIA